METIMKKYMVRPSSPTSHIFKTHKLSYLDQMIPQSSIPFIFFYENNPLKQHDEISRRLKQSLSEILTIFYPLAGTIKQNSTVDCDDSGAAVTEARVQARLLQFTQNPKMDKLKELLPTDNSILSAKISFFDSGGIAVAVSMSHQLGDGASFATFMNAWAATCRGEEASRIIHPRFDLAIHFPPMEVSSVPAFVMPDEKKLATKRLIFDGEKLEKLRKQASATSSRVEAVSAFLWRNFIYAAKAMSPPPGNVSSAIAIAVNMRPRAVPLLPDQTFGNCVTTVFAVVSSEEDDGGIDVLASKLRAAVRTVDDDFFKEEKYTRVVNEVEDLLQISSCCFFSSLLGFPLYEVDFGWGKHLWIGPIVFPSMNGAFVLMPTPSGDGVEAWVNTLEADETIMLQNRNDNSRLARAKL